MHMTTSYLLHTYHTALIVILFLSTRCKSFTTLKNNKHFINNNMMKEVVVDIGINLTNKAFKTHWREVVQRAIDEREFTNSTRVVR